jgi:hypothetical protein
LAPATDSAGAHHPISRKKRHRISRYITLAFGAFVVVVWLDGLLVTLPSLGGTPARGERVGVIHVHTNASGGSGSLPEVIDTAKHANLSFVAITDHNLALSDAEVATADPPEFAVIDGEEVSTANGHYLALGISGNRWNRGSSYDTRSLMRSTREAGAVNFIAHPYGLRDQWTDWGATDYDGIEIFNDDAVWRKNTVVDLVIGALLYPVNSRLALLRLARTPNENFAKWDQLLQERPVAGICGSDAHAKLVVDRISIAKFPSYLSVFSLARQHVLLPEKPGIDPDHAGAADILAAIQKGSSFCAVDALYPAEGFRQIIASSTQTAGPGEEIQWMPGEVLHIQVPTGADHPVIRVLKDGHEIAKQETHTLDLPVLGPGHYRTEAYLRQPGLTGWHRWTLWLFANPVTVTQSQK